MSVGRHSIDANLMWMVWILLVLFVGSLLVLFNETFNRHAERILIRLKRAAWHDKIKKFLCNK
jgi:hypothetical protein